MSETSDIQPRLRIGALWENRVVRHLPHITAVEAPTEIAVKGSPHLGAVAPESTTTDLPQHRDEEQEHGIH